MKKYNQKSVCYMIILSILFASININLASAKEPIMQEKYMLEEYKIKRAYFIWRASIEELRENNILSDENVSQINRYLNKAMKGERFEGPSKKYTRDRKALRVETIDDMVKNNIITYEQGESLRKKLNKYDLSNLE